MKKIMILAFLISTSLLQGQDRWRELVLATSNGVSLNGNFINNFSVNLSYELDKDFTLSSWNGVNHTHNEKQSWFASQTTLDKKIKKLTLGTGYLYGASGVNSTVRSNELYFIFKLQYRIKL
jgi:hypothetical protein